MCWGDSMHCALLLDYVPPEEPPSTPLGNTLRIRKILLSPKMFWENFPAGFLQIAKDHHRQSTCRSTTIGIELIRLNP